MQTTNIGNMNFKGLYKIPNTQNNIQLITKYVIPPYQLFKKQPVVILNGLPQDNAIKSILKKIADSCQGSVEWLYKNAENFGVNIPEFDNNLYVITGESAKVFTDICKDVNNSVKPSTKNKFKNIFIRLFKTPSKDDLPKHIRLLKAALKNYYEISDKFKDFYGENKILNMDTPQNLYSAMMRE